jgi:hypothetical protein
METVKTDKYQAISFKTKLFTIKGWTILRFPEKESAKLPSRGQVMVEGTINGHPIQTPLEPDGKWSHWFRVDDSLLKTMGAQSGDNVELSIYTSKVWPEPDVPTDIREALDADPKTLVLFNRVTPMARWEWIRWIRSTNSTETRAKRIRVAFSKLNAGERRPCCWNRNLSTEPSVSKNGVLLDPAG